MEDLIGLIKKRKEKLPDLKEVPKVVFSFSSKHTPEVASLLERYFTLLSPSCPILLSLFDVHYFYNPTIVSDILKASREIILDSGNFEANGNTSEYRWDDSIYVDVSKSLIESLESSSTTLYLVNYDTRDGLSNQIENSVELFSKIGGNFERILLLHPEKERWNKENLERMIKELEDYDDGFDILGLSQSEIGEDFFDSIRNVFRVRTLLNDYFENYIPVHIFGCIDSKSIIFYTFAGADVFDGLNWLRFYYNRYSTYHWTEFYMDYFNEEVLSSDMIEHNVEYIKRLTNDLHYTLFTEDVNNFKIELQMLEKLLGGV